MCTHDKTFYKGCGCTVNEIYERCGYLLRRYVFDSPIALDGSSRCFSVLFQQRALYLGLAMIGTGCRVSRDAVISGCTLVLLWRCMEWKSSSLSFPSESRFASRHTTRSRVGPRLLRRDLLSYRAVFADIVQQPARYLTYFILADTCISLS
jgi:hypothetical protein